MTCKARRAIRRSARSVPSGEQRKASVRGTAEALLGRSVTGESLELVEVLDREAFEGSGLDQKVPEGVFASGRRRITRRDSSCSYHHLEGDGHMVTRKKRGEQPVDETTPILDQHHP